MSKFHAHSIGKLKSLLLKPHRSALKHPKTWLIGLLVLLLGALAATTKLQMLLSIDDLIDPDFKTYQHLKELNRQFIDKNNVFILIRPSTSLLTDSSTHTISKAALCDLKKWINLQVTTRGDIQKVFSTFGARQTEKSGLSVTFPTLLAPHCETPGLEEAETKASLQQISKTPWHASLTSTASDDVAINFYLADTQEGNRFGNFDPSIVKQLMESFETEFQAKHPELKASWAGVGVYQYYLRLGFDLTGLLNLAMMVLIFVLSKIFFGSFKSGLLFILTILASTILVYGGMALTGCPIDVLTNTLPLMLVISSLEDFLFITHLQTRELTGGLQVSPQQAIKRWPRAFRTLLLPGFFTSLTTVIGFASLVSADLGIIRRFGLWCAIAAAIEWAMTFLFLPAFLKQYPKCQSWLFGQKTSSMKLIESLNQFKLPRTIAILLLSVYFVGIYGMSSLHVTDSPPKVFPESHPIRQTLAAMLDSRGWQTEVSLLLPDFKDRDQNSKIIEKIRQAPAVAAIEDPYQVLDFLTRDLSPSQSVMVENAWKQSPSGERLVTSTNEARAILFLKQTDITDVNQLVNFVSTVCPNGECHLAGSLISYAEFGNRVLGTLLSSLGLSLLLVGAILVYLICALKMKHGFWILVSALWGPMALLALFYIAKLPIFYITSMFAAILVGLAGDNTIQYLFAGSRLGLSSGVKRLGGASIQVSLAMIFLSAVLFGSYFAPLRILGALLMIGFFLGLVGDLWLLKGLLPKEISKEIVS